MAATASIDAIEWLRKQIEETAPDPLKTMLTEMVSLLMSAEVEAVCGAGNGERSGERVNSRNGYRARPWDTRVGTIDLQIPKLRQGSYFPGWLLEPRRRAEKALTAVVAEANLLGVSTRKVEDLAQALGIAKMAQWGHPRVACLHWERRETRLCDDLAFRSAGAASAGGRDLTPTETTCSGGQGALYRKEACR